MGPLFTQKQCCPEATIIFLDVFFFEYFFAETVFFEPIFFFFVVIVIIMILKFYLSGKLPVM